MRNYKMNKKIIACIITVFLTFGNCPVYAADVEKDANVTSVEMANRIQKLKADIFDLLVKQEGLQAKINEYAQPLQDQISRINQIKQEKLNEIIELQKRTSLEK